jgi:membrane dipeptidase
MLHRGWKRGETSPQVVGVEAAADHIDHIAQLAGDSHHCAIGTDLDGRFGTEQTPRDLDTIADVHKLEEILARRGYSQGDIDAIFYRNWLEYFERNLAAAPTVS